MSGLQLEASVAARGVELALDVPAGATWTLIGPNASGKSTALGIAAGLVVPDRGRATLGEQMLFDLGGTTPHTWRPPHRRRVALLAQDPLLFPHLNVLDNVAFGPRSAGASRREARDRGRRWLAEVDVADLADRPVRALSGGQSQRVALARALATEPELLLLDEPLAALDVDAASAMRQTLRRVLADRTTILVSHDPLDIAVLADDVVVLDGGRVIESGPLPRIATLPRSPFAASLFGLNLLRGEAQSADSLRTADGRVVHGRGHGELTTGEPAMAVFYPVAVAIYSDPPAGSPRNVLPATVAAVEPQGQLVRVRSADVLADVTPAAVVELDLNVGQAVFLVVKAAEVSIYPA